MFWGFEGLRFSVLGLLGVLCFWAFRVLGFEGCLVLGCIGLRAYEIQRIPGNILQLKVYGIGIRGRAPAMAGAKKEPAMALGAKMEPAMALGAKEPAMALGAMEAEMALGAKELLGQGRRWHRPQVPPSVQAMRAALPPAQ